MLKKTLITTAAISATLISAAPVLPALTLSCTGRRMPGVRCRASKPVRG